MKIQTGKIKINATDAKLQELAVRTLLPQAGFPDALEQLFKPSLIQGIIQAEHDIWELNDDMPSIPDAWGRALFAMALPFRGPVEMDKVGWIAAAGVAGVSVGVSAGVAGVSAVAARFGIAIAISTPTGWTLLGLAGLGALLVEGLYGVVGAVAPDFNATVGRGQIGQAAWDDATQAYGRYFSQYLDEVMQAIGLKKQMQQQIEAYKLNNISVKYNPMDKKNVKVLENFMITAVLLNKMGRAAARMTEGRSALDALKYGIAAYHSVDMNAVNRKLGREGALKFPSKAEFATLGEQRAQHYAYIETVLKTAEGQANKAEPKNEETPANQTKYVSLDVEIRS